MFKIFTKLLGKISFEINAKLTENSYGRDLQKQHPPLDLLFPHGTHQSNAGCYLCKSIL